RRALASDIRPLHGEIGIHLEPLLRLAVGVGNDRLGWALGLAHPAVDAFVGMDHQHVVALVEAVDGADLHAVHVLALDAVFGDDVSHLFFSRMRLVFGDRIIARRRTATRLYWFRLQA